MSIWLSAEQLARTRPAERDAFPSPIPTQVVSNGEWMPPPQSDGQKRVEAAIGALADAQGQRHGLSRRDFLRTASGMAAAFLAMNSVYGPLFGVAAVEAADPAAAKERLGTLGKQFIIDVQLHFVRDDLDWQGILMLGEYAKKWNPVLEQEGVTLRRYKFQNFVKEVFLDSDTRIGLVSAAPSDDPKRSLLTNADMAGARAAINGLAGGRRMLCHSVFAPGFPGWLEDIDRSIETFRPDSWKGYTVGDPLGPSKYPWRMDDEKLVYPAYEKFVKSGITTVCVHKGLVPAEPEKNLPNWKWARVDDVGKAAKDWPQLKFVIYHAGLKPFMMSPEENLADFEETGRMDWVTDLAEIPEKHGVKNLYGEIGTSFASSVVTHPRHAAAMMGILVKGLGENRVVWGSDSVWYGSPQWQVEAMRRLEIPEDLQKKHGFAPLGAADGAVKNAIFAGNAAKIYGIDTGETARAALDGDGLALAKREYEASGEMRSNLAYGYVRAS